MPDKTPEVAKELEKELKTKVVVTQIPQPQSNTSKTRKDKKQ